MLCGLSIYLYCFWSVVILVKMLWGRCASCAMMFLCVCDEQEEMMVEIDCTSFMYSGRCMLCS